MRRILIDVLREAVRSALEERRLETARLRADMQRLEAISAPIEPRLARLEADLAALTAPFTTEMTVHQAWVRHPGVRRVFTRHHLPACDQCAVGADETLGEAAFGYQMDLDALLAELNALLVG